MHYAQVRRLAVAFGRGLRAVAIAARAAQVVHIEECIEVPVADKVNGWPQVVDLRCRCDLAALRVVLAKVVVNAQPLYAYLLPMAAAIEFI